MNPAQLRRGAVISLFSSMAGLVAVFVYDTAAYSQDADTGITVILTEGALFLAIAFIGIVAATYVSVRHVRPRVIRQGVAAILVNWAAAFVPAALAFSPFVGGLGRAVDLALLTAPYFLLAQAVTVTVTAIINIRTAREGQNAS
ncbi:MULTISPECIES: hypothetical protein [unclassified Spirillospora]|uniref:hypothetical protein n=1 Tax=unclassified Spirillospora TaxID=2642701 RepID=UPI00371BF621